MNTVFKDMTQNQSTPELSAPEMPAAPTMEMPQ
jgi:hypothetical protein